MPRKNRPINPFDTDAADRIRSARARKGRSHGTKKRSDVPGDRPLTRLPELTADFALQFVKILAAGVPAIEAIAYFAPEHYDAIDDVARDRWSRTWLGADAVIRALNKFNGGAWEDIEKDRRVELAIDRALAGLAYFLVTHDYATVTGEDLKKHDAARKDLMEYVKSRSLGDAEAPWMQAMREIVEGQRSTKSGMPPMLAAVPIAKGES